MAWFANFITAYRLQIRQKRSYQITTVIIGLLLLFALVESGLNFWVRQALRQSLTPGSGSQSRMEARIGWLSLNNLLAGRFGKIALRGEHCQVGRMKLQQLQINSNGLSLDLKSLLHEKKFVIKSLSRTRITVRISEIAATEYFAAQYPQLKPQIVFLPDRLCVSGTTEAFGKTINLRLEGALQAVHPKKLRFYPKRLQIARRLVPRDFLKYLGERIPLETEVLQAWPLQIEDLTLEKGFILMQIREIA